MNSRTGKFLLMLLLVTICSVAARAEADSLVSIAVARFTSATSDATNQQASSITDVFTDILMHTPGIAVVGGLRVNELLREPSKAAQAGRTLGCQYVILGSVTQLKETVTKTGIKKRPITNSQAEATLYIRVINAPTGETVYSELSTGHASGSELSSEYIRPGLSTMKQEAVISAAQSACKNIRSALAKESAHVISTEGGSIILNKGSLQGVQVGDIYLVYTEGRELRDLDGTFLGNETENIAILEICEVQAKYSRALITRQMRTSAINAGDKTRPLSREESEALMKQGTAADRASTRQSVVVNDEETSEPEYLSAPPLVLERISIQPEKVIAGYDLPQAAKRSRISAHKKLLAAPKDRNTYNSYVSLAKSYNGDYLASYQAGATALALGMKPEAYGWFKRALRINPDYRPAQDGLERSRTQTE